MDIKVIDNIQFSPIQKADKQYDINKSDSLRVDTHMKPQVNSYGTEEQPMSEKEQQNRLARLQETLKNHNIEISYNDEVNRYSIKVLDAESKEVVKEIPSEKSQEMFARMLEIEGLLVDEKR